MSKTALVHVISDALGDTACEVVLAAAGQFPEGSIRIERLPHVTRIDQIERYLKAHVARGGSQAVFYTIVDAGLRDEISNLCEELGLPAVDLMGPATSVLTAVTESDPMGIPGIIHRTDERYFDRIACMEYVVDHDDGRGADDLSSADLVLIGISRTSKTPLSMYLAFQGYRVANIPLAPGIDPPDELFSIDPARIFGLLSTPDIISTIRSERLGDDFARGVAGSYASYDEVARELESAHALMKRLGCFIVRTDGKSIEESAAEIIRHYERVRAARKMR